MKPDPIKAKIQELCPDNVELRPESNFSNSFVSFPKPTTLAVVLRAIQHLGKTGAMPFVYADGEINVGRKICFWNLEHDDYDQQGEECKQFIGSLLGITN